MTEATVAEKLAVVAPAATVTEAGTVIAELELFRLTENPVPEAGALRVTEQVSVPAPVMEEVTQENADSAAVDELLEGVRKATICMIHGSTLSSDAVAL